MSGKLTFLLMLLVGFIAVTSADAGVLVQTFDVDPTLAANQTPGAWYTDRYAPAAFESVADPTGNSGLTGGNVLRHGISASDFSSNNGFINTQGRKFDTPYNTIGTTWSADLYIPLAWVAMNQRIAGMWATTFDATDSISGYPIVEFASDGTDGRFQFYNSSGFFVDLGLPSDFVYDEWYTLSVMLTASSYEVSVQAATGASTDVLTYSDPDTFGSVRAGNIILQGINTGTSFDIYWDNVTTEAAAVPEPSSLALLAVGTVGLVAGARRRRKKGEIVRNGA